MDKEIRGIPKEIHGILKEITAIPEELDANPQDIHKQVYKVFGFHRSVLGLYRIAYVEAPPASVEACA